MYNLKYFQIVKFRNILQMIQSIIRFSRPRIHHRFWIIYYRLTNLIYFQISPSKNSNKNKSYTKFRNPNFLFL